MVLEEESHLTRVHCVAWPRVGRLRETGRRLPKGPQHKAVKAKVTASGDRSKGPIRDTVSAESMGLNDRLMQETLTGKRCQDLGQHQIPTPGSVND